MRESDVIVIGAGAAGIAAARACRDSHFSVLVIDARSRGAAPALLVALRPLGPSRPRLQLEGFREGAGPREENALKQKCRGLSLIP